MAKIKIDYTQGDRWLVVDGVRIPSVDLMEVDVREKRLVCSFPITEMVVDGEPLDIDELRSFIFDK